MARVVVIDSSLNPRLSTELKSRGRLAVRTAELGLKRSLDPELLRELSDRFDDFVLVTADDAMPHEHAELVTELSATIATIDPRIPSSYNADSWGREIVHRWVHRMETQPNGSSRRYSIGPPRPWTKRRR